MFLVTQLLGLAVIHNYSQTTQTVIDNQTIQVPVKQIPYGMQPPEIAPQTSFTSIITAIIFVTLIMLLLSKIKATLLIKLWFAFVVTITTAITINSFIPQQIAATIAASIALALALTLTYFKIVQRNLIIHNITELLIYPGLAAIFVPMFNIFWIIILLIAISIYDFIAVIKTKHMIKLAKFQLQELKVFTGFFIPYLAKKDWKKIKDFKELKKQLKDKSKAVKEKAAKKLKDANIKVNLAILGGGDIAFPLIFSGIVLTTHNLTAALITTVTATLALLYLLTVSKKGKFYPAMPFIAAGSILGYVIAFFLGML